MLLFDRSIEAELLANQNIELGVVGLPQGEERANILFWEGYGVASTSAYPRTAANLLTFYTGEPGAEVWVNTSLPTVLSVAESSGLSTDPIASVWINELNFVVPRAYTFTPYWNEAGVPAPGCCPYRLPSWKRRRHQRLDDPGGTGRADCPGCPAGELIITINIIH